MMSYLWFDANEYAGEEENETAGERERRRREKRSRGREREAFLVFFFQILRAEGSKERKRSLLVGGASSSTSFLPLSLCEGEARWGVCLLPPSLPLSSLLPTEQQSSLLLSFLSCSDDFISFKLFFLSWCCCNKLSFQFFLLLLPPFHSTLCHDHRQRKSSQEMRRDSI